MGNLPISGLPNLTTATNSSLIPIVASGVTYNIDILDFWKSPVFGTMYQDWIPDSPSAHTIGSVAYPIKDIYISTGSVYLGPTKITAPLGNVMTANVGFASPLFQVGNVNSDGDIITTSGYSITDQNRELIAVKNSTGEYLSISQQLVQTGGTVNQVLTMTANTSYGFGWVTPTQYVPTGGTTNQLLTKTGLTPTAFGWVTQTQLIPTGGTQNQVLTKGSGNTWGWSGLTASQIPTRYYGSFTSNVNQTNPVINQVNTMSADTTEMNNGVILSANTRFVTLNAGVYNIQFSAQFQKTDNGDNTVYVWFKKNGVNIPRSNTAIDVLKQAGGSGRFVAAWNIINTFDANDYVELVWQSDDSSMILLNSPASGNYPSDPSLILTITQV